MSRACSTHEAKRNAYIILVGKPEGSTFGFHKMLGNS
jgi:hypothetical protein